MSPASLITVDDALNQLIQQTRIDEAIEQFYDDNVEMQENLEVPMVGKAANLAREREFFGSLEMHGWTMPARAVGPDVTFNEYTLDFTPKGGQRMQLNQVTARRWQNGKVVHERFYHKG